MTGNVLISALELDDLMKAQAPVLIDTRDPGSWNEWSRDSTLPIEAGRPYQD